MVWPNDMSWFDLVTCHGFVFACHAFKCWSHLEPTTQTNFREKNTCHMLQIPKIKNSKTLQMSHVSNSKNSPKKKLQMPHVSNSKNSPKKSPQIPRLSQDNVSPHPKYAAAAVNKQLTWHGNRKWHANEMQTEMNRNEWNDMQRHMDRNEQKQNNYMQMTWTEMNLMSWMNALIKCVWNCTTCHAMPCMSCHVMPCHVMSCHVMSSCHAMPCHVMSCHVMIFHVMSCHVMSCHVIAFQDVMLMRQVQVMPWNMMIMGLWWWPFRFCNFQKMKIIISMKNVWKNEFQL